MTRTVIPGLLVAALLALAACKPERDFPGPCGTCPENRFDVAVSCTTCDPAAPITLTLTNDWPPDVLTTICDWRLMGAIPGRGWEEVQRPDCSVTLPLPILIAAGAPPTAYLVELEPDSLPPLGGYDYFSVEVRLVGTGDEQGREWTIMSPSFGLAPAPGSP